MSRQIFHLPSLCAGAVLLTALGTASNVAANPTDTIQVKLSDGATMTLFVKNPEELRKLRAYKMDSLMVLLDRYITQAQTVCRAAGDAGRTTMEFSPARDLNNPNAPEKLRVVVYNRANNQPATTSTHVDVGSAISINVAEGSDGTSSAHVRIAGAGVRVQENANGTTTVRVGRRAAIADSLEDAREEAAREARRQREDEDRTNSFLSFGFGLNTLVNAESAQLAGAATPTQVPISLDNWGSRYAHLGYLADTRLRKDVKSAAFVRYGVDFAFHNYMIDGNRQWVNAEGVTKLQTAPDGRQLDKSKLATTAVQVPLQLGLRFRNDQGLETVAVAAGGFAGYRLSARTKEKYQLDGDTKKVKERGSFNLQDFQYGLTGSISIFGHELFATYNLNEVFRKDRGPQANVIAFGWNVVNHRSNIKSKKYGRVRHDSAMAMR